QANNIEIWLDDYHRNNKLANMSLGKILWDRIKIDKSFLKHADQESIQALEYFLAPFCLHGLIFEGAEYIEHHKMLKTSHSLTQGYYYFRPSPINSLDSKPRVADSIKLSYAG
ncbi:diguanylate phosphodiesterase, partial [Vibrio parahaemolyticus]